MPMPPRSVNPREPLDPGQPATLPSDSHDAPVRHRCNFDRSPLVVARRDLCGAMARLID
jgi:hypothetical protein